MTQSPGQSLPTRVTVAVARAEQKMLVLSPDVMDSMLDVLDAAREAVAADRGHGDEQGRQRRNEAATRLWAAVRRLS